MSEGTQRRLAAIVSADVVGYSRLMGADEGGTHARLKERYTGLVAPSIDAHGGRVVKLMGDGLLAEFPSVVDAVAWAIEAQGDVAKLDSGEPAEQRIEYRIDVNLGDIIVDDGDIFGDGVNIAARLQEIAEPGGVCISQKVHAEVAGKVAVEFNDGGAQQVKNIAEPVHVWFWSPHQGLRAENSPGSEASTGAVAAPALPDKPSIAVLPFENMSGDQEQEYFVDGMVEDILTTLSKVSDLFVIARNSSFTYKGRAVDVREVGRELGVKYVVEGSIRKAGNRVRVTAQLVECANGGHLWAERFDGELDDVFALQDKITLDIVAALQISLTDGEQGRIWRQRAGGPEVYASFQKARKLYSNFAKETHQQALRELETALSRNADYPALLFIYGFVLVDQARFGWVDDRDAAFSAALDMAERALAVDPYFGDAYSVISYARSFQGQHEDAVIAAEQAVALNPNGSITFHMSAMSHIYAGNFETGRDYEEQASRLSPMDQEVSLIDLARAQYHLGDFEAARGLAERVLTTQPRWLTAQTILLAAIWRLGRKDETERVLAMITRTQPRFSVGRWAHGFPYKNAEDLDALMAPLRQAGLPD